MEKKNCLKMFKFKQGLRYTKYLFVLKSLVGDNTNNGGDTIIYNAGLHLHTS